MTQMQFEPQTGEAWTATLQEQTEHNDTWKIEGFHNGTLQIHKDEGQFAGYEWDGSDESLQPVLDGFDGVYE